MKPLTKAEEQVMLVLWKLGNGFLKDILDATPEPKPHPNTIATLLRILVEKGFVEFHVKGRNNCYSPLITKADYGKTSANQLVKGYYEGSAAKLLSQFVTDKSISLQELESLLRQIRSAKKSKS
jgi:predicted transcriptional regulator